MYREEFVAERKFESVFHRNEIIKEWKREYRNQWDNCAFQIKPFLHYTLTNEDGTNRNKYPNENPAYV